MTTPATPTDRPPCAEGPRTLRLVRARETDDLSRENRRLLLEHLAACGACRAEAVSLDPTLLFAPLAASAGGDTAGTGTEDDGRRLAADVRAVLEARRIDRRMMRRPSHPYLAAAALLVAGAGLAGLLSLRPWGGDEKLPSRLAAAAGSRVVPAASAPLVEGVESPGVKVYQFAADAPGQPAVVFVVDRNADL